MAVKLDVAPLTDITAVFGEDSFERPMYAGNAVAKVTSSDKVKVFTVRTTSFEKAAAEGGSAAKEDVESAGDAGKTKFVSEEMTKRYEFHARSQSRCPTLSNKPVHFPSPILTRWCSQRSPGADRRTRCCGWWPRPQVRRELSPD